MIYQLLSDRANPCVHQVEERPVIALTLRQPDAGDRPATGGRHSDRALLKAYSPGVLTGSECLLCTLRTIHQTESTATGTEAAVTISGASTWPNSEVPFAT